MIAVQNLPSMIGNRKTNSPDFPGASNEDSFGSQDMSNLTLRDRTRVGLSLNDLEPRKQQNFSSFAEFPSQSKLTDEAPQSTPTPTQILFPKNVTEEQEAYVRGFSQALEEIYRQHGPPASSVAKYVETTQHLEEKRTDPLTTSCYGQTWFYNDSKSSVFSASQVDQKPNFSQLNSNVYEPPFVPLSSYPTMVEDSWQNAQSSSHSNFSNVGQMFVSSSNDEVVVGSLPSTSFSSAGQKRNLSKMASQSLGSLTPSSIGSPCGSDVAVHSRAVAGEIVLVLAFWFQFSDNFMLNATMVFILCCEICDDKIIIIIIKVIVSDFCQTSTN